MSLHVIDQSMDGGLQIVGFCDSGPTMSPASAILRFWNVDSALFTPLDRRPRLVDCGVLDSWKVGGCAAAAAIRNLGIVESGNVLQIWHQTELWNLGILESAQHIVENDLASGICAAYTGKSQIPRLQIPQSSTRCAWLPNMAKNRTFHDSAIHRRHENNRHSHFPRIQNPRLPSCSLERCAGSSDTGSVKNAQPQSRERSTLVRRRRMVQSPRYMSTDSTFRSRAGQRRVVSPRIQRQRTNHGFLRMTVP